MSSSRISSPPRTPSSSLPFSRTGTSRFGLLFISIIGIILFSTMALLPPYLQNLKNYPVIDVGVAVLRPRHRHALRHVSVLGAALRQTDARIMIAFGLTLTSISMPLMTQFTLQMSGNGIRHFRNYPGFRSRLHLVPLSTITFSTLAQKYRNEGTALFSSLRNIGSSIVIPDGNRLSAERTQIMMLRLLITFRHLLLWDG